MEVRLDKSELGIFTSTLKNLLMMLNKIAKIYEQTFGKRLLRHPV